MLYEELHERYGTYIAKRVSVELTPDEFKIVSIDNLASFLETRAEQAHKTYQAHLQENLLGIYPPRPSATRNIESLHSHWRSAEDLAYLVTVAADVAAHVRSKIG